MIEFAEKNHVNPMWLIGLLQKQPQHFRLDGPNASEIYAGADGS